MDRIRYVASEEALDVAGFLLRPSSDTYVLPVDLVANASLKDLHDALQRSYEERIIDQDTAYFTSVPSAEFDYRRPLREGPELSLDRLRRGRVVVHSGYLVDGGQEPTESEVGRLVGPVVERHRAHFDGIWTDTDVLPHALSVGVLVSVDPRRRSVGDVYELGRELSDLLAAVDGSGELVARSARDLVRGGKAAVLVGQPESSWLDVKQQPYRIDSEKDKFELAKDVAAFATPARTR